MVTITLTTGQNLVVQGISVGEVMEQLEEAQGYVKFEDETGRHYVNPVYVVQVSAGP